MAKQIKVKITSDYDWGDDTISGFLIRDLRQRAEAQKVAFPKRMRTGGRYGSREISLTCKSNALYDFCVANIPTVVCRESHWKGVSTVTFEIVS